MSKVSQDCECSCLCGAVTFKAALKNEEVGACHCSMCRQWSGGVFLAIGYEGTLVFEDTDALGVYKSSDWGERGFCTRCGSSLFWRTHDESHGVVSAQAVSALASPALTGEIFVDSKPDYYNFREDTRKMTGAEVMAMFAPKSE